jgi:hypothetical protein
MNGQCALNDSAIYLKLLLQIFGRAVKFWMPDCTSFADIVLTEKDATISSLIAGQGKLGFSFLFDKAEASLSSIRRYRCRSKVYGAFIHRGT